MTISLAGATGVTTATGNRGTTSTTAAYVGVAAGRLGVITACVKPAGASTTFPTTVTDGAGKIWGKAQDASGGTGTVGVDTGAVRIAKYIRVLDGTETGNVTITCSGSPTNVTAVMDTYASTVGGWRTPWGASGSDASHGTNPSANTAALAQALAVGDWVHAAMGSTTDNTAAASAHNIAQTSTTFGARTARSRLGNQDGNDNAVFTWDADVTAGGAATAVTLGFTFAASTSGPVNAMVLREVALLNLSAPTVLDAFTTGTSPSASWDNWGAGQVTLSSQRMYVASTTTAGYYGAEFIATQNLDGKILGVRLVDAGNTALASYAAYPVALQYDASNETYWNISLSGSTVVLRFWTRVANVYTARVVLPYVVGVHNYLGVGFNAGQLVGYTSVDGVLWTPEVSLANPYASTTANPFVMVGTDATEASTTAMQIDDLSVWSLSTTHTAAASLAVTATLAAAATREQPAAAALAVTASLSAGASTSKSAVASLAVTATLSAAATREQPAAAALAVTASLSAGATRTQVAAAALSATASLSAAAEMTRAAAATLAVTATLAASATRAQAAAAALSATATLTAAAVLTGTATPALPVTATLTAAATRTREAAAALSVTASLSAAATRAQTADAALPVTATLTAAAAIAGAGADAALPVTATLAAAAVRAATASAALAVTATLAAGATRTQPSAAALAVTATLAAAAERTTPAAAALAVAASLAAAVTADRPAAAALAVTATLTAAGTVGAAPVTIGASLAVTATLAASATRAQPSAAALAITATVSASAARAARPVASLAVTATLAAGASMTETAAFGLAIVATLVAAAEAAGGRTPRIAAGSTARPGGGRTPRIADGGTARPASTRTPRLPAGRTDRL